MNEIPATPDDVGAVDTPTSQNSADDTQISTLSRIVAIISTISAASLISLFVGLCYFYDYSYRTAYFGAFGLDAGVVPVSMPEAVVDGFFGIIANVMLIVAILAGALLVYVVLGWFVSRRLEKFVLRLGIPLSQPLPHPALVELGKSFGFRTSFIATLVAIGTMLVSLLALLLIGLPAESAAGKDAAALRSRFASGKAQCARFEVKGSKDLVGWRIGSSPDRQFVLGNDDAVHVLKFDDLERLHQTAVRC